MPGSGYADGGWGGMGGGDPGNDYGGYGGYGMSVPAPAATIQPYIAPVIPPSVGPGWGAGGFGQGTNDPGWVQQLYNFMQQTPGGSFGSPQATQPAQGIGLGLPPIPPQNPMGVGLGLTQPTQPSPWVNLGGLLGPIRLGIGDPTWSGSNTGLY
jgi:hypothetical protein